MKRVNILNNYNSIIYKFLVILIVGCTFSCQKENVETNPTEAVTKEKIKPYVEPIIFKYSYDYQGQLYTETEWNTKLASIENPSLSIIGLNNVMFVFDSEIEAKNFENGELQNKLKEKPTSSFSTAKADRITGTATVKFKLEFFKNTNYSALYSYTHHVTRTINRRITWWGWAYLEGHEIESDLPSWIQKEVSSYRATYEQGGTVFDHGTTGQPVYLSLRFHLRAGLLSDGGRVSWSKTLYNEPYIQNRKVEQDPDFSDNRLWSAFGITTWDNQIQSWQVEFR
ncbi:hypothetical protein [Kordia jejudonensis]|uniref:hypothetical protein n=1 Tax=Kordia jejudonensis TaxID=1348245 RepID=UPI000629047C|nr:hypothetical protein [Kordia jejudonensis]